MTEVLNNSINGQMDNIKTLNDNMKTNIESSNESIKNAIYEQLAKYLKQNMYGKKIVVGMGAGSISNWMKELPNLIK